MAGTIRATAVLLVLTLNLAWWGTIVVAVALVKLLVPAGPAHRRVVLLLAELADRWVGGNNRIMDAMLPTRWEVTGIEGTRRDGHYLIISNHISWVDILVLFRAFHRRVAILRFFVKQELIWLPFVGQACWAMEFPFMKRYSAEYLEKHPEKRGTDLETTRRACERFRAIPVAILNFVEGTRFSREKHADQDSPYQNLLRPRIGGIAFVLASLGDQMEAMIDVTIVYPRHDVTMWEFMSGQVPSIALHARRFDVPEEFTNSAITEPGPAREEFRRWMETIWSEKDLLLGRMLTSSQHELSPAATPASRVE